MGAASPDHAIARALGGELADSRAVGGGCIHRARRLRLRDGRLCFVKSAAADSAPLLEAEAHGLALLAPHIRVPAVAARGRLPDGAAWLALEWLALLPIDGAGWEDLGRQLRNLHSSTAEQHGLQRDNFIGRLPQSNTPNPCWADFFLNQRLLPQLSLAAGNGFEFDENKIHRAVGTLLAAHRPPASLLHGDLWSGNTASLSGGGAVVFDPAPYHGDAETDLAMLELFGGPLPAGFFRGYGPPAPDRRLRRPLYDLYHALNHLNHFGPGYLSMVRNALEEI